MSLASLPIRDLRGVLPRANWSIGWRPSRPTSVTLHYNGPPVANRTPDGEVAQLIADALYQMRRGWAGVPSGADGLQYHFAVLTDGQICQCRDLASILWHCGNGTGNVFSMAVHLPLGGMQDATAPQWAATQRLFDALLGEYSINSRSRVYGHQEWSATSCPGPNLMNRLFLYRAGKIPQGESQYFQVVYDELNVRQGPGLGYPIADVMPPGAIFRASAIVQGQTIGGDNRWAHRADGMGFGHMSLLMPVTQYFEVTSPELNVRQGPGLEYPIATKMRQGEIFRADAVVYGGYVGSENRWAHRADGVGFGHLSILRPVSGAQLRRFARTPRQPIALDSTSSATATTDSVVLGGGGTPFDAPASRVAEAPADAQGGGLQIDDPGMPPIELRPDMPTSTRWQVPVADTPLYPQPEISVQQVGVLAAGQELQGVLVPGETLGHTSYWLQPTGMEGYVSVGLLVPLD